MRLGEWRHICVDVQHMFARDTPWHLPWMKKALPTIVSIAEASPRRTLFTRFIPPPTADAAVGAWKDYYRRWWMMTGEHLPDEMVQLVPELKALVPPARVIDKPVYSPWLNPTLATLLSREQVETLVVTGGETDVCVMATVLGAIDHGFHVILVTDAVCSGLDETHDASLALLGKRFSAQMTTLSADELLSAIADKG
ncbi:cysteine hydrolase [Rhizobium sp. Root274]|uniref:cysteine hydrolase family protein n=1 Tax=unclassified Rhizobium TaxID=2613769 RepID=UPI000712E6E7|nr:MULTISPECIES: cysteine hydrolase [unclassified Rhizobium]KQW29521.1 cysteine hydrolase [Rhizobium sp. Root1240]KRD29713.1 cysteine hydrolase [Rhizobium sp. Root274]